MQRRPVSLIPLTGAPAHALDVEESGGQPVLELLKRALVDKHMLLVVDNLEHLIEAAPFISELILAAPELHVLATSRQRLRLQGEHYYPVTPLAVPSFGQFTHGIGLEEVVTFSAVELFRQRATAALPSFELTAENAVAVAEICGRMDGLPLAIELAAARLPLFGTAESLLSRLGSGLKLPGAGIRDLPARQQTLRAAIEWSYVLLSPQEQKLFRRLAVFVGGRTVEAIEAVCNSEGDLGIDVLDGIEALLNKSLLRRGAGDGGPRFVMLQTIHDFANSHLEASGELDSLRRAHASFFLSLLEEAEPGLMGPEQAAWLSRLETEHNNLRAALAWSRDTRQDELTMRLTVLLYWFWLVRRHINEGRRELETVLAEVPQGADPTLHVRALRGAAAMAWAQGDYRVARIYLEQGLEVALEAGNRDQAMRSLSNLGAVANSQGDSGSARLYNERGLAIAKELGDKWALSTLYGNLGALVFNEGDYSAAQRYYEQGLAIEEIGDQYTATIALTNLGDVAGQQADYKSAQSFYERGLAIAKELGAQGEVTEALRGLGYIAASQGDRALAYSYLGRSLVISENIGAKGRIAEVLSELAVLEESRESKGRAARLWGATQRLREEIAVPIAPIDESRYQSSLGRVREQLGEEAFAVALAEGQAMSLDETPLPLRSVDLTRHILSLRNRLTARQAITASFRAPSSFPQRSRNPPNQPCWRSPARGRGRRLWRRFGRRQKVVFSRRQ
jgi:predicted ATPase